MDMIVMACWNLDTYQVVSFCGGHFFRKPTDFADLRRFPLINGRPKLLTWILRQKNCLIPV
jgi:hypothetical protein